jgi:hypothetical protein
LVLTVDSQSVHPPLFRYIDKLSFSLCIFLDLSSKEFDHQTLSLLKQCPPLDRFDIT